MLFTVVLVLRRKDTGIGADFEQAENTRKGLD